MADVDPDRLEGASCTATLDLTGQTLTFAYRGFGASAQQKALSPLVVPLGAIGAVEHHRGRFTGWFRIVLCGENPWSKSMHSDPHGLTCGEDPGPFADRVRDAVVNAAPVSPEVIQHAAEEVYDAADAKEEPTVAGRVGKGVAKGLGKGLVHGLFSNW